MAYRRAYLLPQAVFNAAEKYPERVALSYQGQAISYEELATRVNQLAHVLKAQGVKRGDRVGIYMNKSLESAVSLYGIMQAGGVYVPLDPFAPVERLRFVIQDCDIRHVATNESKANSIESLVEDPSPIVCQIGLPASDESKISSVSWDEVYSNSRTSITDHDLVEQDLAYILYTSGSTGDPKGIMHTHRSGLSFAEWAAVAYGLTGEDRLSNHAPLHFDLSTFDFFAGALAGAATVIIPEALTKFPANLTRLVETEGISVWYSVPFALIQMLLRGNLEKHDLGSLRWVLFAGEPFPTKHLRDLMAKLPWARFSNLYGPTETNVCTYYNVPPLGPDSDEPIPIGRPCSNVEALVVDDNDRPVAQDGVGELLIRGGVVMRGYWGQPEMTEKGFYRQKAHQYLENTYYRTGDLVSMNGDGELKYLGRKDRQIKTRGYRVELDEIEVALLAYPMVEEAAVYPVPDGEGSNLIEAAVVAKEGAHINLTELIDHLGSKLPPYSVPVNINVMSKFPRTSTGKIDRRELQAIATETK